VPFQWFRLESGITSVGAEAAYAVILTRDNRGRVAGLDLPATAYRRASA